MKPQKTITELVDLLKSRNLTIEDDFCAQRLLSQINYYRLSGYWRKYQINPEKNDNNFAAETTFEKIYEIYELDTALRNLLHKGLGIFEICFRSKFAYHFAHSAENGQLLYLQQKSYDNSKVSENEKPSELLEKIEKELERSKEKFILHFKKKGEKIPVWAAVEVLSFGAVSKMYSRLTNKDGVKNVYQEFETFAKLKKYKRVVPIIHSLVHLRNLCAHQARIWNRRLIFQVPERDDLQAFGKSEERAQWRIISILMLLIDEINQNKEYSSEVLNLCKSNEEFYKGLIEPNL